MKEDKRISVIIPTLNEEKNLPILLNNLPGYIDEILIVDGYSKDRTAEIARTHGAKVIFSSNGKGDALIKGMTRATGDILIMMDADLSHRSTELGLLIEGINAGYDICMGSRFIQGGGTDDMPIIRRFGNKFFVFLVNTLWRTNYSDLCYGYRSLKRSAVPKLELTSNGFAIETEISIKAAKRKLNVLEIPSFEKQRQNGEGKLRTWRHGWEILKTIIQEKVKN